MTETVEVGCDSRIGENSWCQKKAIGYVGMNAVCELHRMGRVLSREIKPKIPEEGIAVDTGIKASSQWMLGGETHIQNGALFFNMDPLEKLVFIIILAHAFKKQDGTRNEAFISYDTIGREANIHRSTAIKRITALEKRGWLKIKKDKKKNSLENEVNHYSIVPDKIYSDMSAVVV